MGDALRRTPGIEVVESVREEAARVRWPRALVLDLVAADVDQVGRMLADVRPAVIVNCAGRTIGTATEQALSNVVSVARLLDAVDLSGVRPRLVHLGSAAEYGPGPAGEPVRESAHANPVSAYGISKLAATRLVTLALDRGQIDGTVLRVFNAVGPRMPDHTLPGAVVRRLIRATASGSATVETGPLDAVRDFVDVRDIGRAVAAACVMGQLTDPIINIGSGRGHTARDCVAELARCVGYLGEIVEGAPGSPRSSDVPWQVADITEARRVLAWQPEYDLAATCELVVSGEDTGST